MLRVCTNDTYRTYTLEYDRVVILDDLNLKIASVKEKLLSDTPLSQADIEELNLYYVACSRAKKDLINAVHL